MLAVRGAGFATVFLAPSMKLVYTASGNVNWCSHYGKQYGGFPKELNLELSFVSTIACLGIHLEKTLIQKDTCIPIFILALFTIAKT